VSGAGAKPFLGLAHVSKLFGTFRAVDDLSLDIVEGEVFALLGPSGCGKSTTLRQIAGLDSPDSGTITLNGNVLYSAEDDIFVPPQKRNMGMVFQSYAIWPHLTVAETVAYPLALRKVPQAEIDRAVAETLEQVGLGGFGDRPSPTLSGGQQQRVALARALVYKPDVLLLDEPFSNLDVKLREQMRVELKQLQRQVGVTVILVTHDQSEALSLADRIAVMNAGRVEQVGDPVDLYENPVSPFVRDFIGLSTRLDVEVTAVHGGEAQIRFGAGGISLASSALRGGAISPGARLTAAVRPESILVGSAARSADHNTFKATVETLLFVGDKFECHLRAGGDALLAYSSRGERLREGDTVNLHIPKEALSLWPK
jgi:ABC-type Fe3+/spermidine/putrescine transport system ATPase subunit